MVFFKIKIQFLTSVWDEKIVGVILGAKLTRSLTRLRYYEIFNDNDDSTSFFTEKSVLSISDAVVIPSENRLSDTVDCSDLVSCPINLPVYTTLGKFIGKVSDIIFDKTSVICIKVGEFEFLPTQVKSKSENLIVVEHDLTKSKINSGESTATLGATTHSFMLGRKVSADITLRDGNSFLARSGDIVDEKLLAKASGSGKLLLLASNIK